MWRYGIPSASKPHKYIQRELPLAPILTDLPRAGASNKRLQLTAVGARDRGFFEVILRRAPRRQLKRNTLGGRSVLSKGETS